MHTISRNTYSLVTLAYWIFMITDGALRMVLLLRFHQLGYSPVQLSFLFLFYEFAGIITNLVGGWIGARFGLRKTLFFGLLAQIIALTTLSLVNDSWSVIFSVCFVMGIQALAGVAKDLVKMSSKSSVKLLLPDKGAEADSRLFSLVALLTGVKNTLKGAGFFIGGLMLSLLGYRHSLLSLAGLLLLVLILCLLFVKNEFGKSKQKPTFSQLFSKSKAINILSFARALLFASRDVWFVVGVPIFLYEKMGWSFSEIGGFMASWVILYGFIQALAPKITRASGALSHTVSSAQTWGFILVASCLAIPIALVTVELNPGWILILGLCVYGFVFAINSSVHSYLVLAYTSDNEVSLNVGFYYMANAVGRFSGTLLSGVTYLLGGVEACLWTASGVCLIAALLNLKLPRSLT